MISSVAQLLVVGLALVSPTTAQYDSALVGTWTTKSKKVFTGPGFYNPVADKFIEPELTGISYSFTNDGHYEEAYYRALANPTTPGCPSGLMQWQHGTYSMPGNGSLILEPIAVDGRQLMSSPCSYDQSVYTRFSQPELIKSYSVELDKYHNIQRLNLYKFNGSPQIPMFLAYSPPQMLPTQTLNPTTTATAAATATGKSRVKRDVQDSLGQKSEPLNKNAIITPSEPYNADRWWWLGVGLTAFGTVLYMVPTS